MTQKTMLRAFNNAEGNDVALVQNEDRGMKSYRVFEAEHADAVGCPPEPDAKVEHINTKCVDEADKMFGKIVDAGNFRVIDFREWNGLLNEHDENER